MPRVPVFLVIPLVIAVAAVARLSHLDVTPRLTGATYDEAVYATAARAVLHGIVPYRDFFFGHPPVGAYIFSPAMLFDATAWGGPESFVAGRQLSLDYGLVTVALVFAIGYRLAGIWGATVAALAWSLDPRAIGLSTQVILDGPMVMFSFAAILAYLEVHPVLAPQATPRRQMVGLALAGGLAMLSALTKGVGVTLLIAITVDLAWRRFGPSVGRPRRFWLPFGGVLLGAGAASAVALLPFVILAPGGLIRQAVFFQLLRPRTEISLTDRIGALAERPDQLPILIVAGLGLAVLLLSMSLSRSLRVERREAEALQFARPPLAAWSVILLWAVANLLVFASTPRVEPHYQLHVLASLTLIAAGVGLIPRWLESVAPIAGFFRRWEVIALLIVFGAVTVQETPGWFHARGGPDPSYVRLSRYIAQAAPPGAQLLVLDVRSGFIAGRQPNHGATGYLVDPYGHLAYLGLELADRPLGDLVRGVLRREVNRYSSMAQSPSAQTDLLARFADTDLVVAHVNERWRLGAAADTLDATATLMTGYGEYLVWVLSPSSASLADVGR